MIKVCHFTSAHNWNDDRVFLKECQSLSASGYDVYLVAAGETCDANNVHIIGCGEKPEGRRARMGGFARKVYETARDLDCDIYHFHDPELLPYGIKLNQAGKKVIFDSHEDVPAQIMSKYWIPVPLRWIVSKLYKAYESYAVSKFDAVVTATPAIAEKFVGRTRNVVVINNYPKLDDIVFQTKPFEERSANICYAGGLDEIRGGRFMVEAVNELDNVQLVLAGPCDDVIKQVISEGRNVKYLGQLDRKEVNEMYGNAIVGLVLLQPLERYKVSKPVKMYEYMAAGLPFVCSDFPLWRELVKETGAGICVPYGDLDAARRAILQLVNDKEMAQKMGIMGRKAVENKYSWNKEVQNLVNLYQSLQ